MYFGESSDGAMGGSSNPESNQTKGDALSTLQNPIGGGLKGILGGK